MKSIIVAATLATYLLTPAFAGDCAKVPEAYRAQCEAAQNANSACAGKSGEEKKKCLTGNTDYAAMNQCDKESDARKRAQCQQRTKIETACKGRAGNELKACIAAEARKHSSAY